VTWHGSLQQLSTLQLKPDPWGHNRQFTSSNTKVLCDGVEAHPRLDAIYSARKLEDDIVSRAREPGEEGKLPICANPRKQNAVPNVM
jgi:hypothetical protein